MIKYINAGREILGHKVGNKKAIFKSAAEGASIGTALGSALPGPGNIIGAGVGAVVSTIGNFIKGDQRDWFDVIFRDAIKEQFKKAGLDIKDRPYSGDLTRVSMFKVLTPLTEQRALQATREIANKVQQNMGNAEIRAGLADIQVSNQFDKKRTLFAFEVKQPAPPKDVTSTKGKQTVGPQQSESNVASFGLIGAIILITGIVLSQ